MGDFYCCRDRMVTSSIKPFVIYENYRKTGKNALSCTCGVFVEIEKIYSF